MSEQTTTTESASVTAPAGTGAPVSVVRTPVGELSLPQPPAERETAAAAPPDQVQRATYRNQEAAAVRAEVAEAIKEMSSVERAAAIAIGGVYAWLATQSSLPIRGAWWIPVLFALVGSLRAYALGVTVAAGREYLQRNATRDLGGEVGWDETYRREAYSPFRTSNVLVWISFLAITLLVGLIKGAA